MAFQIIINIGIAIIWMSLKSSHTFPDFIVGYVIGLALLYFLRRFLRHRFYFGRVISLIKLHLIFIKELLLSNIDLVRIVLRPNMNITPGIMAVPTSLKSDWEITLLAALISLTPGTLSLTFSPDSKIIYVHSIHIEDKAADIKQIKDTFEKAIMEVTD